MYPVIQHVNAVAGAVSSISAQVQDLNERLSTIQMAQENSNVDVSHVVTAVSHEDIMEVRVMIEKLQLELIAKCSDMKKELDVFRREDIKKDIAREGKLMETGIVLKVEQMVNKMVKDRMDVVSSELKAYVDKVLSNSVIDAMGTNLDDYNNADRTPTPTPEEDEDYEINVTLNGERSEPPAPKKRSGRPKKTQPL